MNILIIKINLVLYAQISVDIGLTNRKHRNLNANNVDLQMRMDVVWSGLSFRVDVMLKNCIGTTVHWPREAYGKVFVKSTINGEARRGRTIITTSK